MNVADKGQEVIVFVAENGSVSIFEEMAGAVVATVEILGVPRKELPHESGNAVLAAFEQEMNVVAHENPGINTTVSLDNVCAQSLQEPCPVLIVLEYC
ncbi:MAG: hypothetical protein AABY54_04610 [Deltaproteobacteria bacterium]